MVPTRNLYHYLLRAILYTCCQTRNMALLKNISLGKAAKGPLPREGSPSSPWLRTMSPTSRQASPTLSSEIGCASKEKTKRWTWATISVVAAGGHHPQERTVSLSQGLMLAAVYNKHHSCVVRWPFCLCTFLNSHGQCHRRGTTGEAASGWDPYDCKPVRVCS